uniref:Uncharacterized protein n=1 Tax=Mycena chlorophos TaxID=658473 RepID=A0ABQ0LGU2_MYCCL|nr:predicted protein [Mycena chlorophos]
MLRAAPPLGSSGSGAGGRDAPGISQPRCIDGWAAARRLRRILRASASGQSWIMQRRRNADMVVPWKSEGSGAKKSCATDGANERGEFGRFLVPILLYSQSE